MPNDHYSHGTQIDPVAEAELAEWAFSEPCEEPEFRAIAPADIPDDGLDRYDPAEDRFWQEQRDQDWEYAEEAAR